MYAYQLSWHNWNRNYFKVVFASYIWIALRLLIYFHSFIQFGPNNLPTCFVFGRNPTRPLFVFKEDGIVSSLVESGSQTVASKSWSLSDGRWHHVCFTWQHQVAWHLYKDGVQISVGSIFDMSNAVHAKWVQMFPMQFSKPYALWQIDEIDFSKYIYCVINWSEFVLKHQFSDCFRY